MDGDGELYNDDTVIGIGAIEMMSRSDVEELIREYMKKYDLDWNDRKIKLFSREIAGVKKRRRQAARNIFCFPERICGGECYAAAIRR